jgi:hypothetical protein
MTNDDKVRDKVIFDLSGMKGEKRRLESKEDEKWKCKHKTDKLNTHQRSAGARRDKVEKAMEEKYGKKLAYFIGKHPATIYRNRETIYGLLLEYESKKEAERREQAQREELEYLEVQRNRNKDEWNFHLEYQNLRNSSKGADYGRNASSGLGSNIPSDLKSKLRKISDGDIKYTKKPESTNTEKYHRQEYVEKTRRRQRVRRGSTDPEYILNEMFGEEDLY